MGDGGRTIAVSITDCSLFDADRVKIPSRIEGGVLTMSVLSAVSKVTVGSASASVNEGQSVIFSMSFDKSLPACTYGLSCPRVAKLKVKIVDSELGEVYYDWQPAHALTQGQTYTHLVGNAVGAFTDRTVTFNVEEFWITGTQAKEFELAVGDPPPSVTVNVR